MNRTCDRCRGEMVVERYYDLLDDTGHIEFSAWKCVNCGYVYDPVIAANRKFRAGSGKTGNRERSGLRKR